ncbi:MAG: hypothetical protein QOD04_6344 [Pseudonocardiales bacterium]|nr:hypothetical protein [Pseudonocardiales bacterium]
MLVTLPAPMSDTKVTGEITTASMITDILVTAVAGRSVAGQPRPRIYSRSCAPTWASHPTAADASASG